MPFSSATQPGLMFALVLAMLACIALAAFVLGSVAIPARREGRSTLTPQGHALVGDAARHLPQKVRQG